MENTDIVRQIDVSVGNGYPVLIAPTFEYLRSALSLRGDKVAVVVDDNVAALYVEDILACLRGYTVRVITVPAGEDSKSLACFADLAGQLAQMDFNRNDAVLALGGGVVGDLAAFLASTYMRGIHLVAVPTSLLSMVDSSVGGKTAVNLAVGKNLVGTFYQPDLVYVATRCLDTLPQREVQCGWGEIIKYSFLHDSVTLADLQGDVTPLLIEKCVRIKADIVSADERESGVRKLLNLGHTVGHAIERLSGFALSHGECVVKGIAAALTISARYYNLPDAVVAEARLRLLSRGHDLSIPYDVRQLMQPIMLDKKGCGDGVDAVLLNRELRAHIVHLSYAQLAQLMV